MLNCGDYNRLSDLYWDCLKTFDHLNLKLWIFSECTASFKIRVSKVQDFGNCELSPMWMGSNMIYFNPLYTSDSKVCTLANSEDPDKMPHNSIWVFAVFQVYSTKWVKCRFRQIKSQNSQVGESIFLYLSALRKLELN